MAVRRSLIVTLSVLALLTPALAAPADPDGPRDGDGQTRELLEIPGLPGVPMPPGAHVYGPYGRGRAAAPREAAGPAAEPNAQPDPRNLPRPDADIYHEFGTVTPGGGRRAQPGLRDYGYGGQGHSDKGYGGQAYGGGNAYGGMVIGPGGIIRTPQQDKRAQAPAPKRKVLTPQEKQAQIRKALMPKPPLAEARRKTLDDLYTKLAAAKDEDEAKGLASLIGAIWLRSGSDTANLLMQRAEKAVDGKDLPLALKVLDRVVELQPNWAEAWNKRASVRYLNGDLDGAMSDVDRVLKLEPKHFLALSGMGAILQRTGFDKRALQVYRRALAIYPHQPELQKVVDKLTLEVEGQGI